MQPAINFINRFYSFTEPSAEVKLSHVNPPWALPNHSNPIFVFIKKEDGYTKLKAFYNRNAEEYTKINGSALPIIMGWIEINS